MRRIEHWAIVPGIAAVVWALGCGGDDSVPPPLVHTVDVRNGTWSITETSSYYGADSCAARGFETLDTTTVLCNEDVLPGADGFPASVTCDLDQDGDQLTLDCRIRTDFGPCLQTVRIFGGGTVTDTTFDLEIDAIETWSADDPDNATFCQLNYGRFADPCTLRVHSVGVWVDSTGSYTCPPDTLSSAPLPGFLPAAIRASLARR